MSELILVTSNILVSLVYSYMNKLNFPYIVIRYNKRLSGSLGFKDNYYTILLLNFFDCNVFSTVYVL